MNRLREALLGPTIVCDGGMGTQLVERGLRNGDVPELWNIHRAADVAAVHRAYVDAGCQCVTTNTFGASSVALARHGLDAQADTLNAAGVRLARDAVAGRAYVLGDIGPLTQMLEPYGDITEAQAFASFAEQARALVEAGADGLVIETMSDPNELGLAVGAARSVTSDPVIATFAFSRAADGTFRTMMGTSVAECLRSAIDAGADVVGANCGTSLSLPDYLDLARDLVEHAGPTPVIVQPNAGSPKLIDGRYTYDATPDAMASLARDLRSAGVRIMGGCCGTTPAHLDAISKAIRFKDLS
jgi:5-methyltetrahydrofolate--homocysteine methyltransferase